MELEESPGHLIIWVVEDILEGFGFLHWIQELLIRRCHIVLLGSLGPTGLYSIVLRTMTDSLTLVGRSIVFTTSGVCGVL